MLPVKKRPMSDCSSRASTSVAEAAKEVMGKTLIDVELERIVGRDSTLI